MVTVLFWSKFREGISEEAMQDYHETLEGMLELSKSHPGFISRKAYTAEDGERLLVVNFENEASLNEWRILPDHRAAQEKGRMKFYEYYRIELLISQRAHDWTLAGT